MALMPRATHVLQWPVQRASRNREVEQIPENRSQFGLESATRLHEVGIASNRESAGRGDTFPGLVHTARQAMEAGGTRSQYPNFSKRELPKVKLVTGAKS